ncbi:MAG TPA: DUF4031 domain-containing protein [Gemmatimonadales bacterium]
MDTPIVYAAANDTCAPRCFRGRPSCHLFSNLPGLAGSAELLSFAQRIGMKPSWVQNPGTPREHFDLVGSRIDAARRAGAVEVDFSRAVEIWNSVKVKWSIAQEEGSLAAETGTLLR